MSRWPIRWRLTAWYAIAMTALLAALGATIYVVVYYQLSDQLVDDLDARVKLLAEHEWPDGGPPAIPEPEEMFADDDAEQILRVWAADGTLIVDSWGGDGGGLTPEEVRAEAVGTDLGTLRYDTIDVGGESYHRVALAVGDGLAPTRVIEVGLPWDDVDETLAALRLLFLIVTPIALAMVLGGGYGLAGRVLLPVREITGLARRISGDDLSERLALDLPDDELGRLAGTFDDMLDRVEDAFERQRRFTGDAAHELRTPLSLIRTRVDLALVRDRPVAEYRETLVELDRDVERLGGLVGTLLALARSDAGTTTLDRRPADLRETVRSVVEQYREAVTTMTIRFTSASEPVVAAVDEDLIIQLLVNLIDNAVAHTPPGGTVDVGAARLGESVSIWVADTGAGVGAEHLNRLFDRFYRVDAGRTSSAGGLGLGLSICKTIVEAHGGTIAIASEVGVGTRVEVTFPIGA